MTNICFAFQLHFTLFFYFVGYDLPSGFCEETVEPQAASDPTQKLGKMVW